MKTLSRIQGIQKRGFDITLALLGIFLTGWLIVLAYLIASVDTRSHGLFTQQRVGKGGRTFTLYKIKTMRPSQHIQTTVTTANDPRITCIGRFLRKSKIDELPQLWNVFIGDMSFVGPRPDVPGFADKLNGDALVILSVRPGITGPATLHFRREEEILAAQPDPDTYNRLVLYPEKVRLNIEYLQNWCFKKDLRLIWKTLVG
ncbi:sugar transferase [Litchfieldella rifensis]|uniref:Sugar transferase n=1 Tax=Litchfieldella rifensis TaxID=762643 RepID=A0ABV7LT13_9GAMM